MSGNGIRVAVEGSIGAGKTTMVRRLAARCENSEVVHEVIPMKFLGLFYDDPRKYGLGFQTTMLSERLRSNDKMGIENTHAWRFWDRSLIGDFVFAYTNYVIGNLEEKEYAAYKQYFEKNVTGPRGAGLNVDAIVYLTSPPHVCRERILERQRIVGECRGADEEYLKKLDEVHRAEIGRLSKEHNIPVVRVEHDYYDRRGSEGVQIILDAIAGCVKNGTVQELSKQT